MPSAVRPLTRDKLAAVFKTPEVIRAFEAMVTDVGVTLPAAVAAVEVVANAAAVDAAAAAVAAGDALAATVDLDARVDALEALPSPRLPIGSLHISITPTNPATTLGYGAWSAFGTGRVIVGVDVSDPDFDTVEETGGSKTATI